MAHPFNNANLSQKPEVPDATGSSSAAVPNAGRPSLQLGSLPGQNLQITPTPSPSSSGAAAPFPSAPVLSAHHSPPTSAASGRRPKPSKPRPGPLPGPISSIQTPHTPGPRVDALEQEFHRRPIGDFADVLVDSGNMIRVYTNELQSLALIGSGQYGTVEKMQHITSKRVFAVKKIRAPLNSSDDNDLAKLKTTLMEHNVAMQISPQDCPSVVRFYGTLFREGDVWLLMELMDTSLDRFYRAVFKQGRVFPERILGMIMWDMVSALGYLYTKSIMHRDIKPSNILLSREGRAAICDFGISGVLVNSLAKTDIGCKPYMAPERINPKKDPSGYGVSSDIWSLGITIVEVATGRFPYSDWSTPFQQLKEVVDGAAPRLPDDGRFSKDLQDIVAICLDKEYKQRPKYRQLLQHPFLKTYENYRKEELASFISEVLDAESHPAVAAGTSQSQSRTAQSQH